MKQNSKNNFDEAALCLFSLLYLKETSVISLFSCFCIRLRLKKEFEDFKKHPEYNNFVREECVSSSSSDEDEERGFGKDMFSLTDLHRRSEEEDLEHVVPRGLWSGGKVVN